MKEIIIENEWIIYQFIKKYGQYYNKEDLYQAGSIGIIKAYNNYKPSKNIKFSSYAYNYVLGEIINYIKNERNIRVSDEYISLYKKYLEIKKLLTEREGKEVSFDKICKFMEVDELTLLNIIKIVSFTKSIDNEYNYGNDYTEEIDNKILIHDQIEMLDSFDKSLVYYRYFDGLSQSETAEELGISQAKVSRQEKLILSKMKKNICA